MIDVGNGIILFRISDTAFGITGWGAIFWIALALIISSYGRGHA